MNLNIDLNFMTRQPRLWVRLTLLNAVVSACAARTPAPEFASVAADPQQMFADMEARLLEAPRLQVRYTAAAEGAVAAALEGTVNVMRPAGLEIGAAGTFAGAPVTASLRTVGNVLEGRAGERTIREPLPPALNEAVIIGLTRMGILHNLARLSSGMTPDHASGGVRDWVRVENVTFDRDPATQRAGLVALRFAIVVAGQHAADATLWLDPTSGLPVRREQVMSFPTGRMVVTESYEFLVSR
jgi:hypothetical protein